MQSSAKNCADKNRTETNGAEKNTAAKPGAAMRRAAHPGKRAALAFAALGVCVGGAAMAQSYPVKPLRIITQFAAGSGGDVAVRITAVLMSEILGQAVVVENRAGGGGMVAAESVARSAPDGYTLLAATPATQVMRVFMPRTSIDPLKDFQPITAVTQSTALIIANPSFPPNNMTELIEYAKRNPGKISFGTSGVGTEHHISAEQIEAITGIRMVHVPYKSGIQAMNDVMAGTLPLSYSISAPVMGPARGGKLKIIALVGDKRYPRLPDVGTVVEAIPSFEPVLGWTGLFTAAGLPQPVLRKLAGDTVKGITSTEGRSKLYDAGFDVLGNTPEDFTLMIRRQVELVGRILKTTGLKLSDQ